MTSAEMIGGAKTANVDEDGRATADQSDHVSTNDYDVDAWG